MEKVAIETQKLMKEKTKKAFQDFIDSHKEPITDVAEASKLLNDLINGIEDWINVDLRDQIIYDNLQACKYEDCDLWFSCFCRYPSADGKIIAEPQQYRMVFERMETKLIKNVPCIIIYSEIGKSLCGDLIADGDYVVIHDKNYSRSLYEDVKKLKNI